MAKAKKLNYVSVAEVSIENLVDASKGTMVGQRKASAQSGKCWAQTTLWLNDHKPLETYDADADVKDIAESIRQTFKDNFLVERTDVYGEITEETEGRNARTGKMIEILDKNGDPKWSSWEETKLPIGYCGDLAQVVKAGLVSELIVSDKKVMARVDILNKAKVPETPLASILRACDLIAKKGPEVPEVSLPDAIGAVEFALAELRKLTA